MEQLMSALSTADEIMNAASTTLSKVLYFCTLCLCYLLQFWLF